MYSPTTSPYGYSSFPKEEIQDTIDFLVSPIQDTIDYHLIQNIHRNEVNDNLRHHYWYLMP